MLGSHDKKGKSETANRGCEGSERFRLVSGQEEEDGGREAAVGELPVNARWPGHPLVPSSSAANKGFCRAVHTPETKSVCRSFLHVPRNPGRELWPLK